MCVIQDESVCCAYACFSVMACAYVCVYVCVCHRPVYCTYACFSVMTCMYVFLCVSSAGLLRVRLFLCDDLYVCVPVCVIGRFTARTPVSL